MIVTGQSDCQKSINRRRRGVLVYDSSIVITLAAGAPTIPNIDSNAALFFTSTREFNVSGVSVLFKYCAAAENPPSRILRKLNTSKSKTTKYKTSAFKRLIVYYSTEPQMAKGLL